MIKEIYAQEDLSIIHDDDIVFFLAGPTNLTYRWRCELVTLVTAKIGNQPNKNIYFLIPESKKHVGCSTGKGNNVVSLEYKYQDFFLEGGGT